MWSSDLVGVVGRVTGPVGAGTTGEVLLPHRGSTAFFAKPADPGDTFEVNAIVMVVAHDPTTRTVYVDRPDKNSISSINWDAIAPPPV
jgi:hypothetical protein